MFPGKSKGDSEEKMKFAQIFSEIEETRDSEIKAHAADYEFQLKNSGYVI